MQLPQLNVGLGYRFRAVTVFPLFCPAQRSGEPRYRLAIDEIPSGTVKVQEVNPAGEVSRVLSINDSGDPVLFLEGQQMLGAKQDRILNTSVMVGPASRILLPVSCVERGRWRAQSGSFRAGGGGAPVGLRRVVKASVTCALATRAGFVADQQGVWNEVSDRRNRLGASSATCALQDVFASSGEQLDHYASALQYVHGATGVALGIRNDVVSVDLFDRESTCRRFWEQLVKSVAFDALCAGEELGGADVATVFSIVRRACEGRWIKTDAVGLGQEYRGTARDGLEASALEVGGRLIHFSAIAAQEVAS